MAETTCPVFKPTEQEFKSFRRYIEEVVDPIAGKAGLCKIIPPPGWAARRRYAAEEMCKTVHIPAPIRQCVSSSRSNGVYSVDVVENPPMSLAEFKEYADKRAPFPSSTATAGCPGSAAVGVRRGRSGKALRAVAGGSDDDEEGGSTGGGGYGGGYGASYGGGGGSGGAPTCGARGEESEVARRVRMFWRSLGPNSEAPVYGADTLGTLFSEEDKDSWNVGRLDTILQLLKANLPGITTAMLYAGMWRSMFAFHVEDVNLYSINYLHRGDPKSWYGIPPDSRQRFESLAQAFFTEEFRACKDHMRHKTTMISPLQIQKAGIGYCTAVQEAGEFMITFPGAYHGGFNHGFNLAESTNFAIDRWIREGRGAGYCRCSPHSVRIDVDRFETLVRQHRRIAGRDSTCLNGLAEAPVGASPTGGRAGDKRTSKGPVDARPATAAEAFTKVAPQRCSTSVGQDVGVNDESGEGEGNEEDVQVFHCVCSNVRSVRHVTRTVDGSFVVIPSGKASPSAAWPEDEESSECPRCGVWGHKACLEYVVPPQFAISEVKAAHNATTPTCSARGVVAASGEPRKDDGTPATRDAPEVKGTSRVGETGAASAGCGAPTAKALEPDPFPAQARVFRPVCWMCMQEKEDVAAVAAGTCGGGAAAPAPRRPGKGSGGSKSGPGGGGGRVCSATFSGEDEGGGSAMRKGAKKKNGKVGETAAGETAKVSDTSGGGGSGGFDAGGRAGARASAQSEVARTPEAAALGPSKRARVGPRLVGKEVLVSDGVAAVLTGVVTAIEAGQARVHYKGRNAKLDEWIDVRSERFLSASEAKKQIALTHLAMNPSASTAASSPRGSAGTKRKAASGGGGKSAVAGSGGKRPKKSGEGGGANTVKTTKVEAVNAKKGSKAGTAGDKKTSPAKTNRKNPKAEGAGKRAGAGKKTHRKTPAASSKKHGSSGDGKSAARGKEAAGRGRVSSPKPKGKTKADKNSSSKKSGKSVTGTKNSQGGKKAGKHASSSSGMSQVKSDGGSIKKKTGDIKSSSSDGAADGDRKKKKSIAGGSGSGSITKSSTKAAKTKDNEVKKKTKRLRTVSAIKPVAIAPPVVVQKEVPDHHVISNRRAAVLARTFAKETKEAQKDFEEAVAAAERSRVAREQRLKASSSLRSAACAAAVKPSDGTGTGAGQKPAVSATSGTPGVASKGGTRWPELGFGGQPWGLSLYRQEQWEGRETYGSSESTRDKEPENAELEEGSVRGGVPRPMESAGAAAATVVSGVPARPRRSLKEMRRARVEAGEALDLGEEITFRKWLTRLRAVQDIPVGHVETCSHLLAVLLGTSPPDGSIRASLRALLVAETLRGGASHEVSAFVRSLAGLMADAASNARPLPVLAPQVASENGGLNYAQALAEQSQKAPSAGQNCAYGAEGYAGVNGACAVGDDSGHPVSSIQDAEGAAAYAHALVHLARSRSKQRQALAFAAEEKVSADATAAVMLEEARDGKKNKKGKREVWTTRQNLEAVGMSRATFLPPSRAPPPQVKGTVPGEYPFSGSSDALLMHAKAMVGLKRTHRWVTAWLNALSALPMVGEARMTNQADAKPSSNANDSNHSTSSASSSTIKKRKLTVTEAVTGVSACSSLGAVKPLAPATHASPLVAAAAASAAAAAAAAATYHTPGAGAVLGWHNAIMSLPSYALPGAELASTVLPSAATTPATGAAVAASAPAMIHPRPYTHGGTRGGLSTDSAYNALLSWWSPQPPAAEGPPVAFIAPDILTPAAATAGAKKLVGAHPSSEVGNSLTSGASPSREPANGELATGTTVLEGGATHGVVDLLERWERVGAARTPGAGQGAEHEKEEEMVIVDV